MKKYTYVPGSFIAAWLIWELIVRLGGFNEALLPTPYKVLLGFGDLALTEDRYNALVHHMTHIDLIKKVPAYSEFVDQSLLP